MVTKTMKSKSAAFFAILLASAFVASVGLDKAQAQTAGFASSRPGETGKAESGSKRIFKLNPFRNADPPDFVDSSPVVQPIASSSPSRSRQLAAASETKTSASRSARASENRVRVEAPARSSAKKASSGAASLLLDELEEDFEGGVVQAEVDESADTVRKTNNSRSTLRNARASASLELLDDSDSEVASEAEKGSNKSGVIVSTDEESDVANDMGIDVVLESTVSDEVSALDDSALVGSNEENEETLDSIDSRMDAIRNTSIREETGEKEPVQIADETLSDEVAENEQIVARRAPIVEINTVGPRKLTVGQESVYKIVVSNLGTEVARRLVVTTVLPESVLTRSLKTQVGAAAIEDVDDRSNAKRSVWNVGDLAPNQSYTLELNLTPTKRVAFELVSNFEFERVSARADVEVQEPILEALIEGRDSIEWGVEDKFRLRIRNIGNGDAENVELFVSTGENKATQKLGTLKAGQEKVIETSIKTVANDFFSIDVEANAAYGVKASTSRKIGVLRGKLDVQVEAPELQFVEGEFEAKIHVRNLGDATLQHVDVVAQIPEGVEPIFCSNQARRNPEKRRVYWSAPFLRPNEETVFSVTCRVDKSGTAKFEVVGVDQTGVVAQSESVMNVESIAVLAMRVKAPKEPVAVGKQCVYELIVENNGTRDAKDVNSGVFLGAGMKPVAIEGEQGVVFEEESKVLFKKIDCLKAGESVVFRLQAQAMAPGNQKIQAMVQSASEDVSLMSEETTYCYSRVKKDLPDLRKPGTDVFDSTAITAEKNSGTLRK